MIKNYLTIALRNFWHHKLFTSINIIGLSIGIASSMLIGLYVLNELGYDHFNLNAERIVRVTMQFGDGGKEKAAVTGTKAGPQLKRTFPQVEDFCRLENKEDLVKRNANIFKEKKILYADASFFKIFSFNILKGDRQKTLTIPYSVAITPDIANKYFGQDNPIDKTLKIGGQDYVVKAIVDNAPQNSQIKFDFVCSFSSLPASKSEQWWTANYCTYLLLNSKNQISALQQQLNSYMAAISKGELQLGANNGLSYNLEPLLSVHLHSVLAGGLEPNGNMETISILSVIGLIILVIACINYVNITVVQATNKSTEIGLRKVLGASKTQIFGQIISSSVLITFISSIFGSLIAIVFLPSFNELTSRNLSALAMINPVYIFGIIIIGIIIAFLSGAYPAYFISNVKLASVLKSGFRLTNSGSPFRKALIIVQFTVSVALIIATIVIFQQLNFMQDKKLGYNRENLIEIPVNDISNKVYRQLKTRFAALPGVISVTGAYASPVAVKWADGIQKEKTSGNPEIIMKAMPCDTGFLKTMDIKMIIGNDFNAGDFNLLDTLGGRKNFRQSFILNESAVKALGWNNETAIGKTLYRNGTEYGMVKGVVHDFHFATLHDKIGPLIMILDTAYLSNIYLKLAGNDNKRLIGLLSNTWAKNVSNTPFEYHFLDEQYNNLYKGEEKTAKTFSIFSILAIVLACMGVFALAAFDAVQRAKEIGIRKVLGATITNITLLLANGFIKLVFIAILIATPLTYYLVNNWLQGYAYRIVISIWVFIFAGVLVIVIAFITTSFLTIKAAIANPVKSLRRE